MNHTRTWAACLILLLCTPILIAQNKDELSVSANFGWQAMIPGDRWSPITIQVSPGQSPLAGTITAVYDQGACLMQASVPFTATPNTTTVVQLMAWIPELCMKVELRLDDDAGRERWRQSFDAITSPATRALPGVTGAGAPLILSLGRSTLPESLRDWRPIVAASDLLEPGIGKSRPWDSHWTHVTSARGDVGLLPASWVAYDGVSAIVVNPDSSTPPDPRAVEAIQTWVASGGRLIIRADDPADLWRQWVPPDLAAALSIDPPRASPPPDEARFAIENVGLRIRRIQESPDAAAVPGVSGTIPAPVASITLRTMHASSMWSPRWATPQGAVILEAPHGFGAILLLGFDPGKTTSVLSATASGAVWRAAIENTLTDVLADGASPYTTNQFGVTSMPAQTAVNTAIERVADVPGVGTSVFVVIVACVLVLGILVGPADYFALRKLGLLQRSWLTSIIWVALAGSLAFVGPRLVRTESTRINRITVQDCIAPSAHAAPVSFLTGITGVYAGDAGPMHFDSIDRASWWRAASPRYVNYSSVSASGLLPIVQRAAGGADGSRRGGPLSDLPIAIWSFRSLADDSSPASKLDGRVRATRAGWSVLISGLPDNASIKSAALRVESQWVTMTREARLRIDGSGYLMKDGAPHSGIPDSKIDGGVWAALFPNELAEPAIPVAWAETDSYASYELQTADDQRPGVTTRLPAPARRARGINSFLAGGKLAVLYLEVSNWPIDTAPNQKHEGAHTRILRVVLPLQEE